MCGLLWKLSLCSLLPAYDESNFFFFPSLPEDFCLSCGTAQVNIFHPLFEGSLCSKCKVSLPVSLLSLCLNSILHVQELPLLTVHFKTLLFHDAYFLGMRHL